MEFLGLLWEGITFWRVTKWSFTALVLYYVCSRVFSPQKAVLSPEERARRRYIVAHQELLRRLTCADRRELEVTLRNTAANVRVGSRQPLALAADPFRKSHGTRRRTVVINEQRNTYYGPEHRPEDFTRELLEMVFSEDSPLTDSAGFKCLEEPKPEEGKISEY